MTNDISRCSHCSRFITVGTYCEDCEGAVFQERHERQLEWEGWYESYPPSLHVGIQRYIAVGDPSGLPPKETS